VRSAAERERLRRLTAVAGLVPGGRLLQVGAPPARPRCRWAAGSVSPAWSWARCCT